MIDLTHNLEPRQLAKALASVAIAEEVDQLLIKALGRHKESSKEPVPERYMGELHALFASDGAQIDQHMVLNARRLLGAQLGIEMVTSAVPLQKARSLSSIFGHTTGARRQQAQHLRLTQAQIDELIALIRAHYRVAIKVAGEPDTWGIDAALERRWRALGVIRPDVQIGAKINDSFIAGRLAHILEDGASLADMRRMAKEFPLSREASLAMQAVQEQVRFDLSGGLGYSAEQSAGRLVLGQNAAAVQDILASYRAGDLHATPTNRDGFSAEEMESLATDRRVVGWRSVGRELRNRMASEDRTRDWERVASSSLRLSKNLGTLSAMQESGVEELYYDVHTNACDTCKELYLLPDGSPRIFLVAQIAANVAATGGANYGRKASKMGDPELGYLPVALAHPWCQCRLMRVIPGVTPKARS